jgi:hypothetical protein
MMAPEKTVDWETLLKQMETLHRGGLLSSVAYTNVTEVFSRTEGAQKPEVYLLPNFEDDGEEAVLSWSYQGIRSKTVSLEFTTDRISWFVMDGEKCLGGNGTKIPDWVYDTIQRVFPEESP